MARKKMTNTELWNAIREDYPKFASHTSKGTSEMFNEKGYDTLKRTDLDALDEFYGLSLRVFLDKVSICDVWDPLEENGIGETYDNPLGAYLQRMSNMPIKPITPGFKGLKDGDSPDPYVVRKAQYAERFFRQNFDFQNMVTAPDDFVYKQIFISEYGMFDFIAGQTTALHNSLTLQKYTNKLELFNAIINDKGNYPLQDSQKYTVEMNTGTPTADQYKNFLQTVDNVVTMIINAPEAHAYNSMKVATRQTKDRLRLVVRQGFKSAVKYQVYQSLNAANPDRLDLDVDIVEVPNFGGLQPFAETSFTTRLYPVYDKLGANIGFATTQDATVPTHGEEPYNGAALKPVYWKDPNLDTYAMLIDKGVIFFAMQNSPELRTILNPRSMYGNYWLNLANAMMAVDRAYTCVLFNTTAPAVPDVEGLKVVVKNPTTDPVNTKEVAGG